MKFASSCDFTFILIISVCVFRAQEAEGASEFRRCYNTSVDMHCFDVQYDTTNNRWLTASFDNARRRCNNLNSTLLIIKDEETQSLIGQFMQDPYNPVRSYYIWTDAYRVNDYNNTYTWHWVDSTLPNVPASNVAYTPDYGWYVAAVAFRNNSFHLTAQQPHIINNYVCEFPVSSCTSISSNNVRQFSGRCYVASNDAVSWYEARNRCLKDGGDLASFANVNSINFTSWLRSDPNVGYNIGLRFTWYIWIDTGETVRYAKWTKNDQGWSLPCLVVWARFIPSFIPSFSWSPRDCNSNDVYVVCHTVTSLNPTTTSTTTTTTSTTTTIATTSNSDTPFNEHSEGRKPDVALAVGVGVGVGVPVIVAIIVIVICVVRLKTPLEQKSRNDKTELGAVQEPPVGQVNESANSPYEQLNRNLNSSSGPMYDELRVAPEAQYEEFPPN